MNKNKIKNNRDTFLLTIGEPVTSLTSFSSPSDEYRAAFQDKKSNFLNYYTFGKESVKKRSLTRGEFWELACSAAEYLNNLGVSKGDRIVHCFTSNSLYDLVLRLASVLLGCSPVTINWQADDNERIIYKVTITKAKVCICDRGFAPRVPELTLALPEVAFLEAEEIERRLLSFTGSYASTEYEDERIIVFTSGTTDKPKGVSLSHRSYLTNRLTYESYFGLSENDLIEMFIVNPLHHTNSTALSDWALRRKGTILHLLGHYTTRYWKLLADTVRQKSGLFITPLVSRHIDFVENLIEQGELPLSVDELKETLNKVEILIGSAPVGPKTIENIRKYSGSAPHVRYGSTEACLQVLAIPVTMTEEIIMSAFQAGWSHKYKNEETQGYYIGREHFPFTRVKVVKSINRESNDFLVPCDIGEPGYLITQGGNLFSYYVGDEKATKDTFSNGWYIALRDIAFTLRNNSDGNIDYYWLSRDSELLIRGGANYAYAQLAEELTKFIIEHYKLSPEEVQLAVVGMPLESEHEDSCCVTIELVKDIDNTVRKRLEADFINDAKKLVSKGAKPDRIRFAKIPRNFKGAVIYPQLKREFMEHLKSTEG